MLPLPGKLRKAHPQPLGQPRRNDQRGHLLPPLDLGDHGATNPTPPRQPLQRKTPLSPEPPNPLPNPPDGILPSQLTNPSCTLLAHW
ncbi:hypothetical protein RxyAA322_05750 [Rubrobacter xylanophilus]|uniref:Uncharacterized protein n=1 Tax=Rubrobacter xylanophilus TaxID=49319 RepID=A0A510HFI5_9ACTN|nr:hypothetical protein RxyAA322_05750 [Rubrobacter xylanophilus]